jgi:hypothetical protein
MLNKTACEGSYCRYSMLSCLDFAKTASCALPPFVTSAANGRSANTPGVTIPCGDGPKNDHAIRLGFKFGQERRQLIETDGGQDMSSKPHSTCASRHAGTPKHLCLRFVRPSLQNGYVCWCGGRLSFRVRRLAAVHVPSPARCP